MWPSARQFKNWTLPSKASFLGMIFGLLGLVLTIFLAFIPTENTAPGEAEYLAALNAIEDQIEIAQNSMQPRIGIIESIYEKGNIEEFWRKVSLFPLVPVRGLPWFTDDPVAAERSDIFTQHLNVFRIEFDSISRALEGRSNGPKSTLLLYKYYQMDLLESLRIAVKDGIYCMNTRNSNDYAECPGNPEKLKSVELYTTVIGWGSPVLLIKETATMANREHLNILDRTAVIPNGTEILKLASEVDRENYLDALVKVRVLHRNESAEIGWVNFKSIHYNYRFKNLN